jgi:ubiquinone/menaquinone biosynthesis C-methylase UbiE
MESLQSERGRQMDHADVRRCWNENADLWTELSQAGYDTFRDYLNTPAFFEMLPDVDGLSGLDVGCGEGHNTRLLAERGARVTAIDVSDVFLGHARHSEEREPLDIGYLAASALRLPFAGGTFDFVTGIMSFMDIPETGRALAEVYRVLRPGGFLQFSITHPCFKMSRRRRLRDENSATYAVEVSDYFRTLRGDVVELLFSGVPPEMRETLPTFKVPRFTQTMSQWLNLVMERGFLLERVEEPRPSDEVVREHPELWVAQVVACFLHVRARKPIGVLVE